MKGEKDKGLMDFSYLEMAAECLKLMAHPVRIRIVELLSKYRYTVGEIAEVCGIPHNQACEHLRLLKNHGLLKNRREGRSVYYSITSKQIMSLLECIRKNCPSA
ncbi:MAG: metalloregulator ArsR/SmtB family transcription factor [Victivallales bacterium]|nr:metalloregulator ArsR/SmtB family transcription factor [Victivallales bacterium]